MVQVMYSIFERDELIFAQNISYDNKGQIQADLRALYEDIKTKEGTKNISLTEDKLTFTTTMDGEFDEVHTFQIVKGGK